MTSQVDVAEYLAYRPLRAPQEDRSSFLYPPPTLISAVVHRNFRDKSEAAAAASLPFSEKWFRGARGEFVRAAMHWTSSYTDAGWAAQLGEQAASGCIPLLLAGHQTEMFHPGVWFKNAVLSATARAVGGLGIHILIDGDSPKTTAVRVPIGVDGRHAVLSLFPDRSESGLPYEEQFVRDWECFQSFGDRVHEALAPLVPTSMIRDYWTVVRRLAAENRHLPWSLAQARHLLERAWGWRTLEVPQSVVCDLPGFAAFAAFLWSRAEDFSGVHNRVLAEYRRIHRIRTDARPMPDLKRRDDWWEVPFWVWSADAPKRRRLYVQRAGRCVRISDGVASLGCLREDDWDGAAAWWGDLRRRGTKIRGRAIVTTMWARMVLGDWFIHGIGGAKYDQVTDAVMYEFCGFRPPEFGIASATVRLPVAADQVLSGPRADPRQLRRRGREMLYHPERFIVWASLSNGERNRAEAWLAKKRRWVETPKTPNNAAERHRAITEANRELGEFLSRERERLEQELEEAEDRTRDAAILSSREFAFCLYPESYLREFFASQMLLPSG